MPASDKITLRNFGNHMKKSLQVKHDHWDSIIFLQNIFLLKALSNCQNFALLTAGFLLIYFLYFCIIFIFLFFNNAYIFCCCCLQIVVNSQRIILFLQDCCWWCPLPTKLEENKIDPYWLNVPLLSPPKTRDNFYFPYNLKGT